MFEESAVCHSSEPSIFLKDQPKKDACKVEGTSISKEEAVAELQRTNEQLAIRWRGAEDASKRFAMLNERAGYELGCGVEELFDRLIGERQEHE